MDFDENFFHLNLTKTMLFEHGLGLSKQEEICQA